MNRRTVFTMSTCMVLCGVYEAYAVFVSPWFSPRVDIVKEEKHVEEPAAPKPAENRRQAELYLSDQTWASDSKYQFRSDTGYYYFMEWDTVEPTGQVRFQPFAMIWRPKGHPPEKAPYTIVSESALVEFASKFEVTNSNPGRVIGGALEGNVRIRGPDNLAIDHGQYFNFAERALEGLERARRGISAGPAQRQRARAGIGFDTFARGKRPGQAGRIGFQDGSPAKRRQRCDWFPESKYARQTC